MTKITEVEEISIEEVIDLVRNNEDIVLVDIRDPGSFELGHLPGAVHITDYNVESFLKETDREKLHVVYCYHGNSSLGGTAYFQTNGIKYAKSMSGGYTAWERTYPDDVEK